MKIISKTPVGQLSVDVVSYVDVDLPSLYTDSNKPTFFQAFGFVVRDQRGHEVHASFSPNTNPIRVTLLGIKKAKELGSRVTPKTQKTNTENPDGLN